MNPALSVVVIGRNEGQRLIACLESIPAAKQIPTPVEVIYIDSNSTDGTPAKAAELGARVIVLDHGRMAAARARNTGWRAASAPFILFLDGDTTLDPEFVEAAMKEFADPEVAVVWGERREIRPEASIYNRVLDLDWIAPPGLSDFCGGDSIMRRKMLERTGGFNPDLIAGEEPDLCRRMRGLGVKILHIAAPMTKHDLAIHHLSQYWRRAVRTGFAYAEISSRYRATSDPLWSAESRGNILRGSLYAGAAVLAMIASLGLRSPAPLLILAGMALAVVIRTAVLARWKSPSWTTLFLFAIHSHLQHVPILQGQILYRIGRWRGQRRELIEYKSS
jgi:glycosyltransferase involved in cell wall biosynthesis